MVPVTDEQDLKQAVDDWRDKEMAFLVRKKLRDMTGEELLLIFRGDNDTTRTFVAYEIGYRQGGYDERQSRPFPLSDH